MDKKHTTGTLIVATSSSGSNQMIISTDRIPCIAETYNEGAAENARRIVACWNFLDGIPTSGLTQPAADPWGNQESALMRMQKQWRAAVDCQSKATQQAELQHQADSDAIAKVTAQRDALQTRLDIMTAERDKLARQVEELEFERTKLRQPTDAEIQRDALQKLVERMLINGQFFLTAVEANDPTKSDFEQWERDARAAIANATGVQS